MDLRCTKHYIIGTCQFKHKSILFRACELILTCHHPYIAICQYISHKENYQRLFRSLSNFNESRFQIHYVTMKYWSMSDTLRNNEVLVDIAIEITAVSIKTLNNWTSLKVRKITIKEVTGI